MSVLMLLHHLQLFGCQILFCSKFGPWTKSQAGLVSCLEPWKNIQWPDTICDLPMEHGKEG